MIFANDWKPTFSSVVNVWLPLITLGVRLIVLINSELPYSYLLLCSSGTKISFLWGGTLHGIPKLSAHHDGESPAFKDHESNGCDWPLTPIMYKNIYTFWFQLHFASGETGKGIIKSELHCAGHTLLRESSRKHSCETEKCCKEAAENVPVLLHHCKYCI